MAKNEYKIQKSWKYPNGEIDLVRGDNLKELEDAYDDLEAFNERISGSVVVKQQDADHSQDPEDHDPSICPIHNAQMELRPGVEGRYKAFYSHKTTDPDYNNDSQYTSWFCNGRPPKGS